MTAVVPVYRAFLLEIERRRQQLAISQDRLSEVASDRSFAKYLHPETPTGRAAQWQTVQTIMDVLFCDGFDLILRPKKGPQLGVLSFRHKLKAAAAQHDRRLRRELMAELGAKGGHARARKLTPEHRREIARRAGQASAASRARGPH
jgi:hypothetical protein